jgi:hypothetical protein
MTAKQRAARRAALLAKQRKLRGEADALLADETRDFTEQDQEKINGLMKQLDLVKTQLNALGGDEVPDDEREDDDEEGSDEEEEEDDDDDPPPKPGRAKKRSRFDGGHPAVVRSRGRRSSPRTVHEHARNEGYSVTRAALHFQERGRLNGVEAEVDQELARSQPRNGQFLIPLGDVRKLNKDQRAAALADMQRRDLTLTTGVGAVPTYWEAEQFVDYLYPIMVGPLLGFKYMNGLLAATKLPRQSALPTVQAVAEEGSASGSSPSLDNVTFNPHTITANVTISRKFAMQSVISADQYVMNTGAKTIGVQMDQWAITGSGSANQPTGLLNNSAVTGIWPASGGTNIVQYSDTLNLERLVAEANANFGNLAYLTSPHGWQVLEALPKIGTTYPVFVLEDGEVNGYQAARSSQVPKTLSYTIGSTTYNNLTTLIFGQWDMLAVATFGDGLDVIVDPFTGSTAGSVTITFLLDMDTNVLQPGAFAYIPNIA